MAQDIAHERCFNHARREAVARCPECGRFFCRECVTEHEGRVVCAACLARLTGAEEVRRSRWGTLARAIQCLVGLLVLWVCFLLLGQGLLALPSSFHEGTVWQVDLWTSE